MQFSPSVERVWSYQVDEIGCRRAKFVPHVLHSRGGLGHARAPRGIASSRRGIASPRGTLRPPRNISPSPRASRRCVFGAPSLARSRRGEARPRRHDGARLSCAVGSSARKRSRRSDRRSARSPRTRRPSGDLARRSWRCYDLQEHKQSNAAQNLSSNGARAGRDGVVVHRYLKSNGVARRDRAKLVAYRHVTFKRVRGDALLEGFPTAVRTTVQEKRLFCGADISPTNRDDAAAATRIVL